MVEANLKELGLSVAEAATAIGWHAGSFRMQAAHDLAKVRQSEEEITVRRLARPVWWQLVEKVADRTPIGARTLIAARQGFTDVNKVAVTGTAT